MSLTAIISSALVNIEWAGGSRLLGEGEELIVFVLAAFCFGLSWKAFPTCDWLCESCVFKLRQQSMTGGETLVACEEASHLQATAPYDYCAIDESIYLWICMRLTTSSGKFFSLWIANPTKTHLGVVHQPFKAWARGLGSSLIMVLSYQNRVLDRILHILFSLSCPTALKANPAQAAIAQGCWENTRGGAGESGLWQR